MKNMTILLHILLLFLPWQLRRRALYRLYGYQISASATISPLSFVYPNQLTMEEGARIGALTVAINLHMIQMGRFASIGRNNWITGYPKNSSDHFAHRTERCSRLILGDHCSITKSHLFDCTESISIGAFTTVAGYGSQFITHGIDYQMNRQDCRPITIGKYCLIGTRVIALGGSILGDYSVLGAGAVLAGKQDEPWCLYAGVPAKMVKQITNTAAYFSRSVGFVD